MKNFMKAFGFLILFATIYLLSSMVVALGIGILVFARNIDIVQTYSQEKLVYFIIDGLAPYTLGMIIMINLLTVGIIWLLFLARKDKFSQYVQFKKIKVLDGVWIGLFGIFISMLLTAGLYYAELYLPIQQAMENYSELMSSMLQGSLGMLFITVTIVAPLFEEVVIRGIIFNDFKKAVPIWVAIIIQALVFGLMHMNLIQGSYAFVLGIVLGIIYLKYKSIWAPIILHFTFNVLGIGMDLIMPNMTLADIAFPLLMIGGVGTVALGSILYKVYDPMAYPDNLETETLEALSLEVTPTLKYKEVFYD